MDQQQLELDRIARLHGEHRGSRQVFPANEDCFGLTVLEYVAAQAMEGIAAYRGAEYSAREAAAVAVEWANALLAELAKPKE